MYVYALHNMSKSPCTVKTMADPTSLRELSVAILKTAVRGIHVNKTVPNKGYMVLLTKTEDKHVRMRFPHAH